MRKGNTGARLAFITALLVASAPATAFKVTTHALVAQQVLDDVLPDGKITLITVDGREIAIAVPDLVREALRSAPESYRAGSIGPDALPGIYEGQMVIHPGGCEGGSPDKWGASEWLGHAMQLARLPDERAYLLGCSHTPPATSLRIPM